MSAENPQGQYGVASQRQVGQQFTGFLNQVIFMVTRAYEESDEHKATLAGMAGKAKGQSQIGSLHLATIYSGAHADAQTDR